MQGLILRMNTGDAVINRSTKILREQTGYEVVTTQNMAYKIADVDKNGMLIVNGHGNPTSLGGYSAIDLAAFLAEHGLSGPVNIELIACNTGFGGAPYALELKIALIQSHKIQANVNAPTRYVAVTDQGKRLTLDATFAANGTVASVSAVPTGPQTVNTPWGPRKVRKGERYGAG